MKANMLKLNDSNTEVIVIGSKHLPQQVLVVTSLHVGGTDVPAVSSARNIGVILDRKLDMLDQLKSVCKSSYVHLCNIAQVQRYLIEDATSTLIHTFIASKLDNLNALLFGLPDTVIGKLQLIQNHAAKIVVRKNKYDSVTPILISLHWLPVHFRINYKILHLTYKSFEWKGSPIPCIFIGRIRPI